MLQLVTPSETLDFTRILPSSRLPSSGGGLVLKLPRALIMLCAPIMHSITQPSCSHLKVWWDVVSHHNRVSDILVETCRRAHIGVQVEVGNNLTRDHSKSCPADNLLPNWFLGKTAALGVSITTPLNLLTLLEVTFLRTLRAWLKLFMLS